MPSAASMSDLRATVTWCVALVAAFACATADTSPVRAVLAAAAWWTAAAAYRRWPSRAAARAAAAKLMTAASLRPVSSVSVALPLSASVAARAALRRQQPPRSGWPGRGAGGRLDQRLLPAAAPATRSDGEAGRTVRVSTSLSRSSSSASIDDQLAAAAAGTGHSAASPPIPTSANPLWLAAVGLCAVVWAGNFPITKMLMAGSDTAAAVMPGSFAALRFGAASLCMAPWLFTAERPKQAITGGLEMGLWLALGYLGQTVGLQSHGAAEACFICSLQVIFVTLWSAVRAGKLEMDDGAAALLAVGGVALLEGITGGGSVQSLDWGMAALMLQPLAFAVTYIRIEDIMEEAPRDALSVTAAQILSLAVCCVSYAAYAEGGMGAGSGLANVVTQFTEGFPNGMTLGILYTSMLGTAVTITLEVEALKHVSSGQAACILTTEPLFAAAWAWWLLGEGMSADQVLGGALILAACLIKLQPNDDDDGPPKPVSLPQPPAAGDEQLRRARSLELGQQLASPSRSRPVS